jgi:class 3 adenylate cyclase/streptogramin lyase
VVTRRRQERFLATILFTDMVGSTDVAVRLGDRDWRRLVAAHHTVVRRQLAKFGGHELDTAGDGFFASFDQPAQAVRAADAIVSEVAALGIAIRAGIHTGEAERDGGKVGGIAVVIAARVMALAGAEEVLVSTTVRDLVSGSGLEFEDRGTHELKGVPDSWHIYALRRDRRLPADADAAHRTAIAGVASIEARARRRRLAATLVAAGLVVGALVVALALGWGAAPPVIAAPGSNTVVTFEQSSGRILEVRQVAAGPHAIAVDGERLWVAAVDAGVLASMSTTGTLGQSTLGRVGRPTDLAVGDNYVWVVDSYAQVISLVDTRDGGVAHVLGRSARHIAFAFGSAWVTDDLSDRLIRLDRQTGAVLTELDLPEGTWPDALAVGAGSIWVANPGTSTLSRVDGQSGAITVPAIPLRFVPAAISATDTDVWIVSRESDALLRLDPGTNSVASTIEHICDQPSAVVALEDSVWVGCSSTTPEIVRVARDGSELGRITLAGVPMALVADAGRVFATVGTP